MSQLTHPRISVPTLTRPRHTAWLGALLALAATTAIVLILALGNESSDTATPVSVQAQPSVRSDGGPEETSIAASVGTRPAVRPDESRVAAAIGASSPQVASRPDESVTAASISGR